MDEQRQLPPYANTLLLFGTALLLAWIVRSALIEQEKNGQQRLYYLAADFTEHLAEKKNVLDLGCCQFNFAKLPK